MPRNAHAPRIAPRAQIAEPRKEMKSDMTAEAFVEKHGPALLRWLKTNTVRGSARLCCVIGAYCGEPEWAEELCLRLVGMCAL